MQCCHDATVSKHKKTLLLNLQKWEASVLAANPSCSVILHSFGKSSHARLMRESLSCACYLLDIVTSLPPIVLSHTPDSSLLFERQACNVFFHAWAMDRMRGFCSTKPRTSFNTSLRRAAARNMIFKARTFPAILFAGVLALQRLAAALRQVVPLMAPPVGIRAHGQP